MLTKQEVEELKPLVWPWYHLVQTQCTKPPGVVKRTAELIAEVGRDEDRMGLEGQCCVYLPTCSLCDIYTERRIKWNFLWHCLYST